MTRCPVVILLIVGSVAASPGSPDLRRHHYTADAMGGTFSIALYTHDRERGDAAASAAFTELRRLDALLSHYRPDSPWSEVNRHAAERPVTVPPDVFEVIASSVDFSRRTEGAFDITVGPLMRAWGFRNGTGRVAEGDSVARARSRVGSQHVLLDPATRTVRFARHGVELDPGGIGKGYAVDRMIAILEKHGIDRALVSASGSSMYALGAPPASEGWGVIIGPSRLPGAERVLLQDKSLSTSGVSGRSFKSGGRTYGHIMDPRTGQPAGAYLAAVVAPRAIDSEAWTKAVLLNGAKWSVARTPAEWRVFLCDTERRSTCRWLP